MKDINSQLRRNEMQSTKNESYKKKLEDHEYRGYITDLRQSTSTMWKTLMANTQGKWRDPIKLGCEGGKPCGAIEQEFEEGANVQGAEESSRC